MHASSLVLAAVTLVLASAGLSDALCTGGHRSRQNWQYMSSSAQKAFLNGLQAVKDSGLYDDLARKHKTYTYIAHKYTTFPIWHRGFLYELEEGLRAIDPTIALPYWEESIDSQNPNNKHIFNDACFGTNGRASDNCIHDGPFANWTPVNSDASCIQRKFNDDGSIGVFYPPEVINSLLSKSATYPAFARALMSTPHNSVHNAIGGDMAILSRASNDPLFFLHHAYIDKLYYTWQMKNPDQAMTFTGKYANGTTVKTSDIFEPFPYSAATLMNTDGLCYDYEETTQAQISTDVTLPPASADLPSIDAPAGLLPNGSTSGNLTLPPYLNGTSLNMTTLLPTLNGTNLTSLPALNVSDTNSTLSLPNSTISLPNSTISDASPTFPAGSTDASAVASAIASAASAAASTASASTIATATGSSASASATPSISTDTTLPSGLDLSSILGAQSSKPLDSSSAAGVANYNATNIIGLQVPQPIPSDYFIQNNMTDMEADYRLEEEQVAKIIQQINGITGYISPSALWNRPDVWADLVSQAKAFSVSYPALGSFLIPTSSLPPLQVVANIKAAVLKAIPNIYVNPAQLTSQLVAVIGDNYSLSNNSASSPFVAVPAAATAGSTPVEMSAAPPSLLSGTVTLGLSLVVVAAFQAL